MGTLNVIGAGTLYQKRSGAFEPMLQTGEGSITNLTATAGNGTTTLTWNESGTFDEARIYRDDVLHDTVTSGVGTWTSGAMADGLYSWRVVPTTAGVEGGNEDSITFGCMTGDVWVDAVNGSDSNDGSSPALAKATLRAAGSLVNAAGMRVVVRGGTYSEYNARITSADLGNPPLTTFTQDGTSNAYNELRSFPGEKVIIDGSSITRPLPGVSDAETPELFAVMGDYWLVSGWPGPNEDPMAYAIEIRNSAGGGFRSRLTTGVRALYINSYGHEGSAFNMQECDDWEVGFSAGWDVYSTVNDGETADGVAGANGSGGWVHDSVFLWCGDDGIDVFNGTDMLVENNVVYKAGYFPNGVAGNGNGNGIKMGAGVNDDPLGNIVRNNIVVGSAASGLTANGGWGIDCYHNTAIGNLRGFAGREGGDTVRFIHNVAYNNGSAKLIDSADGTKPLESYNSWNDPPNPTVTSDDFENLTFDEGWRSVAQVRAALYAKLTSGSDLKGAGENGQDLGYEGTMPFSAPATLTLTPGDQQIAASWSSVPGATLYRYRIDGGAWTETTGLNHTFTGLTNGQSYTIDVQAGDGINWSVSVTESASPTFTLPAIGDPAYGGYMAGIIDTTVGNIIAADAYQTGRRYLLIVSPKSLEVVVDSSRQWSSVNADLAGAKTRWDGLAATQAMLAGGSQYEAAAYVAGLPYDTGDGGSAWYIPAMDELELLYRNLKPTTTTTATSSETNTFPGSAQDFGFNPSSDPQGAAYSAGAPTQTSVTAFQGGQTEELGSTIISSTWAGATVYWVQDMGDGWQFELSQTTSSSVYIRPVRRVYLDE